MKLRMRQIGRVRRGAARALYSGTGLMRESSVTGPEFGTAAASAAMTVTAGDVFLGRDSSGAGAVQELTCDSAGRAILSAGSAAGQRTVLGLGTIATQNANAVSITGGSITGITDLAVPDGGTGQSSFTAHGVLIGNGTGALAVTAVGSTNTVLHGNSGADPTFSAVALGADVSGQLGLPNGGTAANLTASNGGILYSGSSALAILAGTATAGQILRSGASAAPSWSTATYPATVTANRVLYGTSTNVVGENANLTYDGSTLTTNGIADTGSLTVTGANTLIGTTSAQAFSGAVTPQAQVHGTTAATTRVGLGAWTNDTAGFILVGGKSRGTSVGSHTVVTSGDTLFNIQAVGSDGSAFQTAASIQFISDGTPGASDMPGAILLRTTPDGSATLSTRMKIENGGNVLIGTTTASSGAEKLQVSGSLSISDTVLIRTYTAFTNNAGVAAGTLLNAPAAGNPTKWIPINDNGTTRNIPAW